ncbi:MAG: hypothetical protein ACFFKA_03355, partial [Candidatus Thorarchaeota archaeon]
LRRSIDFRKGNFNFIIMGQKFSYYRTIEKFFIPIICVLTLILSIIFFILNSLFLNFNIMTIFTSFNTVLIVIIAFWGLGVFQSKSKGKPLMLWFISFSLLILIGLIFDFLSGDLSFFSRIFYISSPIIGIGFASYFYKLIKIGKIKSLQIKLFLIFLVSFSSITYNIEFFWSLDFYSVNNNELNAVKWYVNSTEDKGVLIIEFGWNPAFAYYDYPFNEGNNSKGLISTQYYITYNSTLIYPENHINENGTNILQQLKNEYQADVYILLSNWFLSIDDLNAFGRLSEEQINQYYSLPYLNRIYSVKSENGGEVPYYWVI